MTPDAAADSPSVLRAPARLWPAFGVLAIGSAAALAVLSPQFAYGNVPPTAAIYGVVAIGVVAGAIVLALRLLVARTEPTHGRLIGVIAVGLVLRLIMLPSTPILEDDVYRYLWDGGLAAGGVNPYRHAPADAAAAPDDLSAAARSVQARVNHPEIRTIYPPVAQAFFLTAHLVDPWGLTGWRVVLLAADLATLGLLLALLRRLGRSPLWAALYWWNPLAVKALFNAGHMDGVLLPFLLIGLWFAIAEKPARATAAVVLAAGIKLWPILLLPTVLRPLAARPWRLTLVLALVLVAGALMAWPIVAGGLDRTAGVIAYGTQWRMNDGLFLALSWVAGLVAGADGGDVAARLALMAAAGGIALAVCRRPAADAEEVTRRFLIVAAAVFLLSPAQFPWYALWFLPFLALRPHWSLLALTPLLALYDLRFALAIDGRVELFDHGIVWLEYLPVWGLLVWEWRRGVWRAGAGP